ncbi:uncharacterized protein LOC113003751 isoform X2 [Solenopsis invicta]|nr:uncharacterized protein LOC113003751 isoform X2 [Solenopsis invicta]
MQMFAIVTVSVSGLLPDVLDFLRPLNESRAHYLLIMKEYRINEGVQYYFFFSYSIISVTIGTSATIFIISTILSINLHCCAIFKICSYRIKQFVDKEEIASCNKNNIIVERIIKTVQLHQKVKKLFKLFTTSFTMTFLTMMMIGTCGFAMSLYSLLNAITCMHNLVECLMPTGYTIGYEFSFFIISLMGQLLLNHSDELFNALYLSLWYKAPITIQKLLLFIMQISSKSLVTNFGGVCVITMETFTLITSKSISIVTVFYSIQ